MIPRRRSPYPTYDPATDGALSLWLDASDTSTLDKAGPLPITDGATVVAWRTKAGTARTFQLIGPNTRPTWEAAVINGLGAVRCNNQILSANVLTGMQSLSGRTVTVVFKQVADTPGAAEGYTVTVPHQVASADGPQVLMYGSTSAVACGGRRLQADAFQIIVAQDNKGASFGSRAVANGETYIVSSINDYAGGRIRIFDNGHDGGPHPTTLGIITAGTTAALNPYAMSVGGILQENGGLGPNTGNGFINGYVCEVLDWFSKLTDDQLFAANDYLRRKWNVA